MTVGGTKKTLLTGQRPEHLKLRVRTRHTHGENNITSSLIIYLNCRIKSFEM